MTDREKLIEAMAQAIGTIDHTKHHHQHYVALARAALTAIEAAGAWKLVPVKPTEAMIGAGVEGNPTAWNTWTDRGFVADVAIDVYGAMLAAAPSPTSPEGQKP